MPTTPVIPEYITVHLGKPNEAAENVTVPFIDYIKNVASSETYPTWPESSLRANIYAIISFALNRVYTEHYRSRGYDFDITSLPEYDQTYVKNRDIYENISAIVDEVFNDYLVRKGQIQPLFAQYCGGSTVTCNGFSHWGTVSLAREGQIPYEILQNYFGDDISMVFNAPTSSDIDLYPGAPLRLGDVGENVRVIQRQLNAISENYPAIPKITSETGKFDGETMAAVKKFQEIFNLNADGTIGKATWYKIKYIYRSIKRLADASSGGNTPQENQGPHYEIYKLGSRGDAVKILQYYFNFISQFNSNIPSLVVDGIYGPLTEQTVKEFQKEYGLTVDGIVGPETWSMMNKVYRSMLGSLPEDYRRYSSQYYPGYNLMAGATGDAVKNLQGFLNIIAENDKRVPMTDVSGEFGDETKNAVLAVQKIEGIEETGLVDPLTWNAIVRLYNEYI